MSAHAAFALEPEPPPADVTPYEAGSMLDRLRTGGMLSRGRAHIMGVEAIREGFGARWAARKEVVWDMTEAQILKRVGAQAFAARLSDTDFIIITPKMEPEESQSLAVRVSREVFDHFLGPGAQARMAIRVVVDFDDQAVACRPLTPEEMAAALAANGAAAENALDPVGSEEKQAPLTTLDGTKLRFSTFVDPIIDLQRWAVAGHRIEPKIVYEASRTPLSPEARRRLLPPDVANVDQAALKKALQRLDTPSTAAASIMGRRSTLILGVSFLTLTNSWALAELLSHIDGRAKSLMSSSVIWEIADFEPGVPPGRLLDCFAALSPYGRAVFVRAEEATMKAVSEPALGRCGLVFQPPPGGEDEDQAYAWLSGVRRAVGRRSATQVAANLPTKDLLPVASDIGFTHATVRRPPRPG